MIARTNDDCRLVDISLPAVHQNGVVGTLLLRNPRKEALEVGKPLRLSVLSADPAIHPYQRQGFVVTDDNGLYVQKEALPGRR